MQQILGYLKGIEGVVGVALISKEGKVIDYLFPPIIDEKTIKSAASEILDLNFALQLSDTVENIELRYQEGRVFIKALDRAFIFFLCAKNVNLHVVATNLNIAASKIEKKLNETISAKEVKSDLAAPAPADNVDKSLLKLPISELASREASASFDSLGMVAISQATAQYISDFYKSSFKKLNLTSVSGKNGNFATIVMKDMEPVYDGTIIIGPSIEKKLAVSAGEKVDVRIA